MKSNTKTVIGSVQSAPVQPEVKVMETPKAMAIVPFAQRYEAELAVVKAHLEQQALENEKALPDSIGVRNALFNSLTLWFLANGYSKGDKVDKDEKKALRASHADYQAAVRAETAIVVTVNGAPGQVTRLGKRKYAGYDKNGVPTRWVQPADISTGLTDSDLDEFLAVTTQALESGVEAAKMSRK